MPKQALREAEPDKKCINRSCEFFNKPGSIIKYYINENKNEYFQCRKCKKGYGSHKGSFLARKQKSLTEIIAVFKEIINGDSIRGASNKYGYSKDTTVSWLKQYAKNFDTMSLFLKNHGFSDEDNKKLHKFIDTKTTYFIKKLK